MSTPKKIVIKSQKAKDFINKIVDDKKAIRRYMTKRDNIDEINARGIKFATPI